MRQNFFKFFTVVYLLALFLTPQISFAQQSEQQILQQYLDGTLQITTQFQKDVVSRYIDQNTVVDVNTIKPYVDPLSFRPEAIHFSENFTGATGTTPPAGWQNVVNTGGNPAQPWQFGSVTIGVTGGGFDVEYAGVNSDAYGSGNTQNTSLITPSINLSAVSQVVLSFSEQFRFITGSSGTLSVSTDGGSNWTPLITRSATYGHPNPALQTSLFVPQAANQANVMFSWTYVGTWGWWWAIDNVVVRDFVTPAAPISFNTTGVNATGMTLEWTDNSTDETSFRVYRSTDNITFTQVGADIPSTTVAGTGTVYSQIQTSLSPSTLYYFRIVSVGDGESSYLTGSQSTSAPGVVTSVASGNWADGSTWSGGIVPTAGDNVTIAAGHTVIINSSECLNLTVQNGAVLEFEAVTARTLAVGINVTIDNGGTFQTAATGTVVTHVLSIGGNLVNNGVLDLSTNGNTAGATLTFTGSNNSSVTGTGATTDLRALTLSKTARAVEVEFNVSNFSVRGASTAAGILITTGAVNTGTLKISGTNAFDGTLWSVAGYNIPVNFGFWLNNPNFTVNGQNGSPTVAGLFRLTAGTFNIGTGTGNSMGFNSGSVITVEGGVLNATGRFGVASATNAITYTQTNGVITVQTAGNASTTLAGFDLGTSLTSVINVTGGTVIVQLANTAASGPRDYRNQAGSGITGVTGGTLQMGNASSGAAKSFTMRGVLPNLVIDNSSAGHTASMDITLANYNNISRNITINPTCTFNTGNIVFLFSGSTITNNGTFTATGLSSNLVWFGAGMLRPAGDGFVNSEVIAPASLFVDELAYNEYIKNWEGQYLPMEIGPQTWAGSGVSTAPMSNFAVQNTSGVILDPAINNIVCRNIRLFEGGVTNSDKLTLGNGDATVSVVQFGNTTTPTAAGVFDAAFTFNLGTGGQTISYLRTASSKTTGVEVNPGRTLVTLTHDDNDPTHTLTVAGGNLSAATLNVTNGLINTSSSNLITVTGTLAGSVTGGSAAAWVNGPLARTFPASLAAGTTYNLPVGKGSYNALAIVDAVTTTDGPVVVQAEVFDANSGGTAGTGMLSLNTNRYWSANVTSGAANLTSTKIRLTEDPLNLTDGIAKSATLAGTYDLVSSSVPSGTTITSDDMASLSFFNIGTRFTGPPAPTGVTATAVSGTQINLAFTPNGANNNVVIVWNTTGTFTLPSGAPVVGDPLAGGIVLSNGTTSPVNHTGLNNTTTYYYKAFSYDGAEYSLGIEVNATTPYGLPYFQDFNAGTTLPAGWTVTSFLVLANHGTSGTNGLTRNFWSSGPTGNARTPFVGAVAANTVLEFDYRIVDYASYPTTATVLEAGNTFNFQVSTDNTNWTTIHTIDNSNHVTSLNFANVSLSLSAYAGSLVYVRVTGQFAGSGDYYFDIDNVYIGGPPVANPGLFSASAVSTTQIDLSFTTNPSNQNVVIVWNNTGTFDSPSGTPPAVGQPFAGGTMLFNGTASPVNHSSLAPTTVYYYRAFSFDGVDYSTGLSVNATTLTPPITTYPFVETFEAVSPTRPAWAQIQELGTGLWTYAAGSSGGAILTAYEGVLNARFVSLSPSGGGTPVTKLVSPVFDLSSLSNPSVTFWYGQEEWFGDQNELKVYYRISPTDPWVQIAHYTTNVSAWTEATLLLPNKSAAYQFAFEGINNYGRANIVDLVTVEEGPVFVDAEAISIERPNLTEELDAVFNPSITVKNNSAAPQDIPVYAEIWSVPSGFRGFENNNPILELVEVSAPPSKGEFLSIDPAMEEKGLLKPFYAHKATNSERGRVSQLLSEDFSGTFPPSGWSTVQTNTGNTNGNPGYWAQYSSLFNSAPFSAGLWWIDGSLQNEWLISPSIQLTGSSTGAYYLSYYYYGFRGSAFGDHYYTKISTDGGTTWTVLADLSSQSGGWNYWESPAEFNLTAYAGQTIKIAWQAIDGDGFGLWYTWLIDDVEIGFGPALVYSDDVLLSAVGSGASVPANFELWTAAPAGDYLFKAYTNLTGDMVPGNDLLTRNFTVEGSAATFPLSVAVNNGWNMVSIPGLHPTDQNVTTWWSGKDPAAGVFRFTTGYNPVTEVAPGIGYWMKHVGANTYNTGDEWPAGGIEIVPNAPLTGLTGWNLIGGYHLTVATSGITTTPGGLQEGSVFQYSGGYTVAPNLVPGYGYWIKLTAGGQINIPTSLAKSSPVTEYIKSDWGRIILTDAAGKSYTLYSVDGEVDLTQYELPPMPPAGMFDVRYGSQRMAEEIGSEIQTIEMSGIEYPVTVRVEGMTIRVQDETGKIVNAVLKSGEDVVISNPMVEKLKVSGNTIPETYSLEQNYPNPFNPSTMIEFSIPEDVENVKLTIYDALGQKVAELVNGKLEAGRYSYQWDASRVSTGLYIYQLQTDKFTSTKKMMLLK